MIALDGEREIAYGPEDLVKVTLIENAFNTINVRACIRYAIKTCQFNIQTSSI